MGRMTGGRVPSRGAFCNRGGACRRRCAGREGCGPPCRGPREERRESADQRGPRRRRAGRGQQHSCQKRQKCVVSVVKVHFRLFVFVLIIFENYFLILFILPSQSRRWSEQKGFVRLRKP